MKIIKHTNKIPYYLEKIANDYNDAGEYIGDMEYEHDGKDYEGLKIQLIENGWNEVNDFFTNEKYPFLILDIKNKSGDYNTITSYLDIDFPHTPFSNYHDNYDSFKDEFLRDWRYYVASHLKGEKNRVEPERRWWDNMPLETFVQTINKLRSS